VWWLGVQGFIALLMDPAVGDVRQLDNYRLTSEERHEAALGCWYDE